MPEDEGSSNHNEKSLNAIYTLIGRASPPQ